MTDPKDILRNEHRAVKIAMYSDLIKMHEAGSFYVNHLLNYVKSDQYIKDCDHSEDENLPQPLLNSLIYQATLISFNITGISSTMDKSYLQHTKEFAEVLAAYDIDKQAYPLDNLDNLDTPKQPY